MPTKELRLQNHRRFGATIVASVLIAMIVALVPAAGAGAGPGYTLDPQWNDHVSGVSLYDLTPDGRFIVVTDGVGGYWRLDEGTGSVTSIPNQGFNFRISDDGRFADAFDGSVLREIEIASGTVRTIAFPPSPTPDPWSTATFDPTRRFVLLATGSAASAVRTSLYDTATSTMLTPEGLTVAGFNVSPVGVSADGRFVDVALARFAERTYRVDRLDRNDGSWSTLLAHPEQLEHPLDEWTWSSDRRWVAFASARPGVLPGLDGSPRLYRRDVVTGATSVVPIDVTAPGPAFMRVTTSGLVTAVRPEPTSVMPSARQLWAWDGSGDAVRLTTGTDGQPADTGVGSFDAPLTSDDGSRVVFSSQASNLPGAGSVGPSRVYVAEITLPNSGGGGVVAGTPVLAGERRCVAATGAQPGDFVGLNITPVAATGAGFGVVHASDEAAGTTSNVNFGSGSVDPNVAFVKVGGDGKVCFTNSVHGPVHVIIDEMIVGDADVFRSPTDSGADRLVDTRTGLGGSIVQAGERRCVAATGAQAGEFVGVNALVVEATSPGFGTVHASGTEPGPSSTVNFRPGSVDPNFAFTQVGADGQICFTNSVHGAVHLILDELIVADADAFTRPATPSGSDRPVDTREGRPVTRLTPSGAACFSIPGAQPGEFGGVNITPIGAAGAGFGTLHTSGVAAGTVSNVNFAPGSVDPNFAIAPIGGDGQLCVTNSNHTSVDMIVDAQVIAAPDVFAAPTPAGAVRLLDTRT